VPAGAPVLFHVHVGEVEYAFCRYQVPVVAHIAQNSYIWPAFGQVDVAVTTIDVPAGAVLAGTAVMLSAVQGWFVMSKGMLATWSTEFRLLASLTQTPNLSVP
jgi:hypothetical protein